MIFTVIHTTMNTDTITLTDRPYIADAPLPVPPDKRPYGLTAAVGHAHLFLLPAVKLRHGTQLAVAAEHQQAGHAVAVEVLDAELGVAV